MSIPDSVKSLGDSVFKNCTSLQSIYIPDSIHGIGESAFEGCSSINIIEIEDYEGSPFCYIKKFAFKNCTSLQTVIMPYSASHIEEYAFEGCSSLETIDISESLRKIGKSAFGGCHNLKKIIIPIERINKVDIEDSIFEESIFETCTLLVPPGTMWEYRHHPIFGSFKNIHCYLEPDYFPS